MLAVALAHLGAVPDYPAALVALLDAWRTERAPRIADLIDRVSERITATRAPLGGKTQSARTAAWTALATTRDPTELGRLLSTPLPKLWRPARDLTKLLLDWPADPRLAIAFARLVVAAAYDERVAVHLYEPLLDRLRTLGDRRVVDIFASRPTADRAKGYGPLIRKEQALVAELAAREAIVSDTDSLARLEAFFAGVASAATAKERGDAAFLDAIYANPDDDDVRRVYADFLGERGDPRGELLASQLSAEPHGLGRREQALIEAHGAAWAGPLDGWLETKGRAFERGFLSKGRVGDVAKTRVAEVFGAREWSTLRTITFPYPLWDALDEILASPTLRGLRTIHDLPAVRLAAIGRARAAGHLPRLEELTIDARTLDPIGVPELSRALQGLRRLTVAFATLDVVDTLVAAGAFERLEVFRVATGEREEPLAAWWDRIAEVGRDLESFEYQPLLSDHPEDAVGLLYQFGHAGAQRFGRLHATWTPPRVVVQPMPALIAALTVLAPHRLHELVVDAARALAPTAHERALAEAAIARHPGLTRVSVPWRKAAPEAVEVLPVDGPVHTLELFGETLKGARTAELCAFAASQGFAFDSFALDEERRRLGDPAKTLPRAAKKLGVRSLRLFRDGVPRSIEVRGDDYFRSAVPTHRTTLVLDGFDARREQTFAWLATFLERFAVSHGVCARTEHALAPLTWLDATSSELGWFTVFGPHHEAVLPRAELVTLRETVGAEVRCLPRHVICLWASSPEGPLDAERAEAIAAALTPIVERGIARKLGYDFDEVVRATLAPALEPFGFAPIAGRRWDHWPGRFLASFARRLDAVDQSIDVSLEHLATTPTLGFWLRKSSLEGGPVGSGRQLAVASYLPSMREHTAETRGALEQSCRSLAESMSAWFDA